MIRNTEGALMLTDNELAALAQLLAGRALLDPELVEWEDVPELSEAGHVRLVESIAAIGQGLVDFADVGGVDSRYVYEEVS